MSHPEIPVGSIGVAEFNGASHLSWAKERCPGQLGATQGKVRNNHHRREKDPLFPAWLPESQTLSILKRSVKQADRKGKPGFPWDLEPKWQSLAGL